MFTHEKGLLCFYLVCIGLSAWGAPGWSQILLHFRDSLISRQRPASTCWSFPCWGAAVSFIRRSCLGVKALRFSEGPVKMQPRDGIWVRTWGSRVPAGERDCPQEKEAPGGRAAQRARRPAFPSRAHERAAELGCTRSTQRALELGFGNLNQEAQPCCLACRLTCANTLSTLGSSFLICEVERMVSASQSIYQCWRILTGSVVREWDCIFLPLALTKTG